MSDKVPFAWNIQWVPTVEEMLSPLHGPRGPSLLSLALSADPQLTCSGISVFLLFLSQHQVHAASGLPCLLLLLFGCAFHRGGSFSPLAQRPSLIPMVALTPQHLLDLPPSPQVPGLYHDLKCPLLNHWLPPLWCKHVEGKALPVVFTTDPLCLAHRSVSPSVVSDSLQPHGLQPSRLLCPWNSPGKNTGVGSQSLWQGIFPTQEWNPGLPHCRQILYHLSHQGSLARRGAQ